MSGAGEPTWDRLTEGQRKTLIRIAEPFGVTEPDKILEVYLRARRESPLMVAARMKQIFRSQKEPELEELPPLELKGEPREVGTEPRPEPKVQEAPEPEKPKVEERAMAKEKAPEPDQAGQLAPVEHKTALELIDAEGIPRHLARIFRGPDGKETPYVLKAGLLWKAEKLFGAGNYGVRAEPVKWSWQDPLEPLRSVFRGVVEVYDQNGKVKATFVDYGVADEMNVRNRQMMPNLDHLAATRATNRALRLAVACGFVSVEEREEVRASETEIAT